ncbi:hypothetical protein QFC22_002078 [Naganishia vaughanmartiniae]|uniref:Uncharacterized protein n=1 Tax=Naganishia vaughanmartiniae TaxID=1424756 RepID=A0ACC2XC12_9TREE|nr:hypothetical protein QFC22_002078 [Naganishia vaughanmartiniae]
MSPPCREVIKLEDLHHSDRSTGQTGNGKTAPAHAHSVRRTSNAGAHRRQGNGTNVEHNNSGNDHAPSTLRASVPTTRGKNLYPGPLGFEERENLRRRAGVRWDASTRNKNQPVHLQPTYSVIPHASSGRAAHTGRGGFPGLPTLIAHLFRAILPSSYTHKIYNYMYDQRTPGIWWAHPFQSVGQALSGPLENYRDAAEAKEAERVRWLPPGVRGVVVGRNSQIYDEELDNDDLEMFAAIEYKALKVLTYFAIAVSVE